MATDPILTALKKASAGLLYPSESDEPFEAFHWPDQRGAITPEALLRAGQHDPNSKVEEMPFDQFFAKLGEEIAAQGEEGEADLKRYRKLEQALRKQLTDLKVFRVGQTAVSIYLIGQSKDGSWAGLRTTSVET
jgi:hypothetical protein